MSTTPTDIEPPLERETRYNYRRRGGKFDDVIKTIGVALIIAGIIGFIGLVFAFNGSISNLRETQSVQAKSIEFLQLQMNDQRLDIRRVEGKVFRGVDGFDDDNADERKP